MAADRSSRLQLGVVAAGSGSNFEAIADAIDDGRLAAHIAVLVCNRPDAAVLDKARARGIETCVIDHREFERRERFDAELAERLSAAGVELVALAGFDRIVTGELLARFPDRVLNIHPALLPAFPGTDGQAQAARYGVKLAGATVHLVDEAVDHGPIVVQAAVPVSDRDDEETLRRRILVREHQIYPWAIRLFAEGRVEVRDRTVVIDGATLDDTAVLISPPLPREG